MSAKELNLSELIMIDGVKNKAKRITVHTRKSQKIVIRTNWTEIDSPLDSTQRITSKPTELPTAQCHCTSVTLPIHPPSKTTAEPLNAILTPPAAIALPRPCENRILVNIEKRLIGIAAKTAARSPWLV